MFSRAFVHTVTEVSSAITPSNVKILSLAFRANDGSVYSLKLAITNNVSKRNSQRDPEQEQLGE